MVAAKTTDKFPPLYRSFYLLTHHSFAIIMYVSTISPAHTPTIEQQVFRIISKRKAIRASRVRKTASLSRDLRFDTVDVVDIILELERNFSIVIPDEVPLYTVGDFVRFVRDHAAAA